MILRASFYKKSGAGTVLSPAEVTVWLNDVQVLSVTDSSVSGTPSGTIANADNLVYKFQDMFEGLTLHIGGIKKHYIHEPIKVRIQANIYGDSTYALYDNTFIVYGYDLGNDVSNGITANTDFKIYLVKDNIAIPQAVIAYRQPFTKKIFYYQAVNKTTELLIDGNVISTNGFICNYESQDISFNVPLANVISVDRIKWFPKTTLSVIGDNCNEECFSTLSKNTAQLDADFSNSVDAMYSMDTLVYAFNNLAVIYKLYDIHGNLINGKIFGVGNDMTAPFTFDASQYVWDNWSIPEKGDYIVEACLAVYDKKSEVYYDMTTDIAPGHEYYIIITASSIPPYDTGEGSTIYTDDDLDIVNAPDAVFEKLQKSYECCKRVPLVGCDWVDVEQTDCSKYKITNLSFDTIIVETTFMVDSGEFQAYSPANVEIPFGESYTFEFDEDNIYVFNITRPNFLGFPSAVAAYSGDAIFTDNITGGQATIVNPHNIIYPIHNYCKLKACLLKYINELICCSCCDDCKQDYCKKYYEFNNLIVLAHTYFNMVNSTYKLGAFYTVLNDDEKLKLYQAKQILDRASLYCDSCTGKCDTGKC